MEIPDQVHREYAVAFLGGSRDESVQGDSVVADLARFVPGTIVAGLLDGKQFVESGLSAFDRRGTDRLASGQDPATM